MKVYFISFNLMNNSTADYFITLSNKLIEHNIVVVISNKIRKTNISLNDQIIVLNWPSKQTTSWQNFWFLWDLVKTYKPDIMISMFSSVNLFLIMGWLFRVKLRVAWIRTLSSQYDQKRYKVLRKSFIYWLSTNIITNSNATKNDVATFFGIPDHKITVLPNSVIDYSHSLREVPVMDENLLYVGRLHPSKGVDVLILAFSQILTKFPLLHLDIIGRGDILNELIEQAELLSISKNVSFVGEKSKEEVLKAFKTSYCTIIPSHSEAFGYTVIEAMSVGTCVIGANNTGIKEIIKHEDTGLLFETGNPNDLAQKLEVLLLNKDYRNGLARSGYKHFIDCYENSIAINRDVTFFKKLITNDINI